MTSFGFQLYSLRAVDDPLPTVLDRVGETPFAGVEFAGPGDADPAVLAATLEETGLTASSAHVGLDDIETDPDAVAATAHELGYRDVVVPWLDPEHFESTAAVEAAADRLSAAADALGARDCRLHYHTHDQEFVDLHGEPALTRLLDRADGVGLQLDLGWAGVAGQDPLAVLDAYADRIDLVHLKDYDAGEPVPVGDGVLPLARTVERVRDHGVDWLVYEAEADPDTYATLDHAAEVVTDLL